MLGVSNAYTLTVRQAPERGKAFSGPKEKDRKPVDPPPIVQLQIRDPQDPASNYLQSPYFFMACNLCDADLNRPGQLAAALQGEDTETASQSSLAGTLVSSLHRLKDIDNSDGGFFVFPDVSVRLEGEFRLRFSLFEMLKTAPKVIYIKSVHTEPFTVYSPRTFPGMSESTFLSRSFGDQGVKLRIRKEPRTLGKRAAPSDPSPTETPQPQSYNPQRANYAGMGIQPHQGQGVASEYREEASGYGEPLAKRLKPAIDLARRDAYVQEERSAQRSYAQQRDPYPQYREGGPIQQSSYYAPQPLSARNAEFPLIGGHQRNISSSASSMLESPRGEFPGYNYVTQSQMYQQPRDPTYQYQYRQTQQMPQAVPPERQLTSSIPVQSPLIGGSYGRTEEQPYPDMRYQPQRQASMYLAQQPQDVYGGASQQSLPRTLPALSQGSTTSALPSMSQDNPAGTLPPMIPPFQQTQYPTTNGGGGLETFTTSAGGGGPGYSNAQYAYRGPREGN